ncbi:MAG: hypothetical protein HY922_03145 [Elusimicrobia bacterium]|nr:hypothetical protein [Elusimicrobiota bacterium]
MDTCESGEVDGKVQKQYLAMAGSRGLKARTTRGMKAIGKGRMSAPRTYLFQQDRFIYNDLIRRSGAIVVSSSRGGEFSYERGDLRNGLFTNAIIAGLTGKASKAAGDIVSTDELRDYVIKTVSRMSADLQHPTVDRDNIYRKFGFPIVN